MLGVKVRGCACFRLMYYGRKSTVHRRHCICFDAPEVTREERKTLDLVSPPPALLAFKTREERIRGVLPLFLCLLATTR